MVFYCKLSAIFILSVFISSCKSTDQEKLDLDMPPKQHSDFRVWISQDYSESNGTGGVFININTKDK